MKSIAVSVALAISAPARVFTVQNKCSFTIWPAIFTDLNVGSSVPDVPTGWIAAANSSRSFNVPNDWKAGSIWGRRNCDFSSDPGVNSCLDGGCNGGILCDAHTGTGTPPITVAEFNLAASGLTDYYDVSLVDGFNLPIAITNNVGCPLSNCPVDLNLNCPANLQGPFDASGAVVGCKSDCLVDPNPINSASCCTGSHNTPSTCPSSGVPHYAYFKGNCPRSYVFPYDESSSTIVGGCQASKAADYTVTFCP